MKNTLLVLFLASFAAGCNLAANATSSGPVNNNITAAAEPDAANTPDPNAPAYATLAPADAEAQKILGSYVGAFGDNKITLMITRAAGNSISGRSVVGGNDCPFDGTYTVQESAYSVVAKEPGDNKYDGVFKFTVSAA